MIGEILSYLAIAVAGLTALLLRGHGKRCTELQKNFVPYEEFNKATTAMRLEFAQDIDSLRTEIQRSYQHIENRIDVGNNSTNLRFDRLFEQIQK
jgi:hypothetical protein